MKPIRLILIPPTVDDPAPWLIAGEDGEVRERGVLTTDGGAPVGTDPVRTVAICPGAEATLRWLDLPAGSAAQLRAAASWVLRDTVAAPPDRLAVVVGPAAPAGEPRLAAVVSRALLQAWIDHLEALGVRADVLLPDVLTVPEPLDGQTLNAVAFGDSLALRGRRFAAAVQPELAELVAGGRPVAPIEDPAMVERALVAAARAPALNLLDGARPESRAVGRWRRTAALAAALAVSPLILVVAGAFRDDLAARQIEAQARAQVVQRLPDLAAAADPAAALREKVRTAPPPGGVSAAAAALFAAVERVEGAELDILVADPGEGVKATISHAAYADMEAIRADMTRAGMGVTVTGTLDDAGRVVSDITIGGL